MKQRPFRGRPHGVIRIVQDYHQDVNNLPITPTLTSPDAKMLIFNTYSKNTDLHDGSCQPLLNPLQ